MKQHNLSNLLVIVLASYNLPVYEYMINIRREQFKRYGLPVYFIIDGPLGSHKLLSDEIYIERTKEVENGTKIDKNISNILFKFQEATNTLLKTLKNITHVLRLNVSTYINLYKLNQIFPQIPLKETIYGTQIFRTATLKSMFHKGFLSGTAVLYSRDVMEYFCEQDIRNDPVSYIMPDDVAIAKILSKYDHKEFFDIYHFNINNLVVSGNGTKYIQYKKTDTKQLNDYVFIRVRNDINRDVSDRKIWNFLFEFFDLQKTELVEHFSFNSKNIQKNGYALVLIFLIILLVYKLS